MTTIDIESILERSGFDRISILKMDIEGAELLVFESGYERWLGRVDNIVIDLEDPECERAFLRAIKGQGFEVSQCDDQRVCRRPPPSLGKKSH